MMFDLQTTPFSRRGSYFAISRIANRPAISDGLYLRTVHGGARSKEIFSISLVGPTGVGPGAESATPEVVTLAQGSGKAEFCIDGSDRVLVRGTSASIQLQALALSEYDLVVQLSEKQWKYICYGSDINLMITCHEGTINVTNQWSGVKSTQLQLRLDPDTSTGGSLLSIEEFSTAHAPISAWQGFDDAVESARADFEAWLSLSPRVAPELEATRELAAYVNWGSSVSPHGHIKRPVIFMSKNWMTNVWAWDHCFNAMALTRDPKKAIDQFLCIFDYQDEQGGIPDCFNDSFVSRNFTKPAVHGWSLSWMMDRVEFDLEFLSTAYAVLEKWTAWWVTHRDYSGRGFPAYNHGNDSGWDNSTVFAEFVPVESPDQICFLVLQYDALARLASRLGLVAEAEAWKKSSASLLDRLVDEFWVDGRFVARHALTRETVVSESLLMYTPLVLGDRLPLAIFNTLADELTSKGFLTEFGLATESTASSFYESDGYWRGPIWAPSTLIIVDGLARGGRQKLAADIARRFCTLAAGSGMAENYDALTGAGLRDRAYTWTASVFLVLASEYASLDA